ncbi:hypothetical protein Ae201684P_003529 [Aphanomyces euteiches]|nr:hypothetical protein Ae201684P_003529 [Aphanomyces euteiches]
MLLPPDYFECPPLSPWEIEQYIVRGTQSTGTLQKKAQLRGGMYDWALLKDDSELKIYKGYSDRMSAVVYSSIVPPLRPPHLASSVEWSEPTPHGQANETNDPPRGGSFGVPGVGTLQTTGLNQQRNPNLLPHFW